MFECFTDHFEESVDVKMSLVNFVLCFMDVLASQRKSLKVNSFSLIASEKKAINFPSVNWDSIRLIVF